ncbi:MAG: SwmB domain-containing protein, partial [Dehalococcoidia bacterium]|nr:SwmB domain-containing protein [Dehalococcoidia bacterium]
MHVSCPAGNRRIFVSLAALGLLAALFLLQSPHARAQFDNTAPLLLAANVDGTSLVLIYSELLNESSTPAVGDYTVDIGGTDYTPSGVAVLGAEVALTLSTGAASGDTVTLDYTVGTNPVEDPAGNDVQALTSWSVTNHTGATNDRPEFSSDTITFTVDE